MLSEVRTDEERTKQALFDDRRTETGVERESESLRRDTDTETDFFVLASSLRDYTETVRVCSESFKGGVRKEALDMTSRLCKRHEQESQSCTRKQIRRHLPPRPKDESALHDFVSHSVRPHALGSSGYRPNRATHDRNTGAHRVLFGEGLRRGTSLCSRNVMYDAHTVAWPSCQTESKSFIRSSNIIVLLSFKIGKIEVSSFQKSPRPTIQNLHPCS